MKSILIGKKGSHVEVIISFVIFVGALVAMYAIVKPVISEPTDKEYIINYLGTKIQEDTSKQLTYQSINVKEDNIISDCFILKDYDYGNGKLIVKYKSGETVNSYSQDNSLLVYFNQKGLYRVYYKSTFSGISPNGPSGCDELVKETDYTTEDKKTLDYIFKSEMSNLKTNYDSNYVQLKTEYNIPDGTNFEFKFTDSSRAVLYEGARTADEKKNKEIYSTEIPITYAEDNILGTDINIKTGFLTVKVWADK